MAEKTGSLMEKDSVVVRFAGDSGDGMQTVGELFADASALLGDAIVTFPDFPSEIRAPAGSLPGVSGFQVHFGATGVMTPGDRSEERRVGKECYSPCRSRWSPYH